MNTPTAAPDVAPGRPWTFPDHRTIGDIARAERLPEPYVACRLIEVARIMRDGQAAWSLRALAERIAIRWGLA